jgi:Rrf2 family protein
LLQVSRRVEYALRAAIFLARRDAGEIVSFKEIADREGVPRDFLAKILRSLVDAGIVRSTRGASGGFALARTPAEVTFLQIIEAADGPVAVNNCCDAGGGCVVSAACAMASVWRRGENAMLDVFRSTRLSDLIRAEPSAAAQ